MGDELATLKIKAAETIAKLFDGIDTSPLTDGLKSMSSLGARASLRGRR